MLAAGERQNTGKQSLLKRFKHEENKGLRERQGVYFR